MEDRDFIDFEFNGHWASEFNLLAVSNGDRYSNSFYGSVNPNTVEMVGKTGVYKWKTQIGEKRFSINIAYDDIDLGTLRKIKEWLNPFVISKLTFKEEPYKYYWVSLADDPEISFLPFRTDDVVVDGKSYKKGVFKGEVTLNFICADNFGYSDWQSFDEDYDYLVEEISDVSNFSFDNGSDNNLIITEIKGNLVQDVVKPVAYTHVEGKNLGLKSQYKDIRNLKVLGESQQEQRPLSQKQASGEQVKLVDVDPNKFIDIFANGNSYQETIQGYNLLNVPAEYTVLSTENNKEVPISLKANTTYTIKVGQINTDNTNVTRVLFRLRYNNADISNPYVYVNLSDLKSVFTPKSNVDAVWVYSGIGYNESAETNTTYKNLMIYEGTAEKSYEPYTGGTPSPNPDYPQEIQNVGDNINLLNKDIVDASNNLRGNALDTGRRLIANKDGTYTYGVFKLGGRELLGKTLGIHADIETTGGNPMIIIFAGNSSSLTKSRLQVVLSASGTGYMTIPSNLNSELDTISAVLYVTTDASVAAGTYVDYTNLKVQVGSEEVVYSAYNCGSLGVTIRNENFGDAELLYSQMKNFSSSNVRKELVDNKNCIVFLNTQFRSERGFKGLKFNYKKNTRYVIRGKFRIYDTSITSGKDLWVGAYDKDGNSIGHDNYQANGSKWIQFSFLTDINSSFDHIDFSYGTTAYWCLDMDSLEIYEGTSVREVPKSQVQTITFPLEKGQKLYEGSYLAADGIHNTRTQIKLLRSSGGFFVSALGNYQVFGKTQKGIKRKSRLLSNYFKDYGSVNAIKDTVGIANDSTADRIYVSNGISTTLDEFEDWLDKCENAGRPVIVEYELATEEIIPYTTTQRQIYDKLKALTIKDGYIHLSVDGLGSISLDYNGYDGSPSPAYPSKIRTVGSNINLFDKDNYTELSLQVTPSTKTLNTSAKERGTYFKCKPNTIYSFQKSTNGTVYLRGNVCETQVVPTDGCSYDNYISFRLENKISYKTSATAKYIYFNFYCIASDISKQELLNSIKIEEEPENTALSAYNKANVETKIENANYYNPANGFNYGAGAANTTTVNADGTITTTSNYSNSRGKGTPVYLKKNTNYYLSLELVSLTVSAGDEKHIAAEVIGYDKFGGGANIVSQIFNIRQTEIGTRWVGQFNSGDCDRWALHISGWFGTSNEGTATYKNVMISEQNIDYVPNETQTVTMPIQQELLTGDYIKDTEHHEWGKLVVTGQENWNQYNRSLTDGYFGAFLAKDDVKNTGIVVCNKLPQEGGAVYNTTGYGVANFMEGYLYICLRREDFGASDTTSLADCTTLLKAYLAKCYADGDPFIIYYKVKKPVDLELTQEQKNTQNFAKNFVFSYPGTNRVYADNDVVKLSASYVPEQNINIDFMVEGSNLLDSSAFYYQNDIFLKAFEDKESGDATKSGISEERPVYLYNAGNKDAALKLDFDLIIPAENSPLTIQIEKGKMTESGFSKISDYSQIAINNFEHYRPFVDIFDGHLENWQIEIDSNLCEVYVKHKTDKTKIISLNKFNENQSFLSLAGSEIVDYAKAFPTSLEEIKNSAIEDTIFNKVTIAPCAQNYRLKNVSLDWKHTYL